MAQWLGGPGSVLAEDQHVWLGAPTLGGSQPPATPAPGDPMPASDPQGAHTYTSEYTCKHTHAQIK